MAHNTFIQVPYTHTHTHDKAANTENILTRSTNEFPLVVFDARLVFGGCVSACVHCLFNLILKALSGFCLD